LGKFWEVKEELQKMPKEARYLQLSPMTSSEILSSGLKEAICSHNFPVLTKFP